MSLRKSNLGAWREESQTHDTVNKRRLLQTGRIILRTCCRPDSFCHRIRCVVTCRVFTIHGDVSHFSLLPFSTPLFTASHFSPLSPVVKGHAGKMKLNRVEKWNIDFFFLILSCFPFFHASTSLLWSLITSDNSLRTWGTLFVDGVSEGPGYSSNEIKCVQQRNWLSVCFLFQNHAPSDLCLMTKNPEDAPNTPDVLEIEFKNGLWLQHVSPVDSDAGLHLFLKKRAVFVRSFDLIMQTSTNYSFHYMKIRTLMTWKSPQTRFLSFLAHHKQKFQSAQY